MEGIKIYFKEVIYNKYYGGFIVNENIKILEDLTRKLVPFSEMIKKETSDYIEFESEGGPIIGFNIYKDDRILVSRFLMVDGASFACHYHENISETLLVIEGELTLFVDEKEIFLKDKELLTILPSIQKSKVVIVKEKELYTIISGIPHSGKVKGNTWILCISMPPEPMFINGEIKVIRKNII